MSASTPSSLLKYRYGALVSACPAKLELEAIKRCLAQGDHWKDRNGKVAGLTLTEHMRKFIALAWPDFQWQRWNEMMLAEICNGGTIAIFGPASSGKTGLAAVALLTLYWAVPDEFTGLCSTTDKERLELRVFGEVKMRYKEARERYPWLAGNLIDSRQRITTDAKDLEGRDFRNGILGIACKRGGEWQGLGDYCFPAGQLVDTPSGPECIATIEAGDVVHTALGLQRVIHTGSRIAKTLVRVKLSDGRVIDCTPEHPFLTQMGWQNAIDLDSQHLLFSPDETLQIVREAKPVWSGPPSILQREVQTGINATEMRLVSDLLHSERSKEHFLRESVREHLEDVSPVVCKNDSRKDRRGSEGSQDQCVDHAQSRRQSAALALHEESDCGTTICLHKEELGEATPEQREGFQEFSTRGAHTTREDSASDVSRSSIRASDPVGTSRGRLSTLLPAGSRLAGTEAGSGDRWRDTHQTASDRTRQAQRACVSGTRVASVEILERAGDERYNEREGGYRVYNLQVEGHPSYSVEGVVVHNSGIKNRYVVLVADESHLMEPGFLQGANNLKANNNAGKFIAIYLGNLVDLETPLGEAAEPECGWDALPDSEVSRVYKTKFFNGRAVQLIGKDSPNFDHPDGAEPYSFLIGRRFIEELKHDCGEGSPIFIAQAGGTIPRSSLANRVITKEVCRKFNAFELVVWGAEKLTRLYCMDVSYTTEHGDRTVGAPLAFGRDIEGKMRLAFLERPKVYALSNAQGDTVEEKIAWLVKAELERFDIPVEHFFYDGTGRSSFTAAAMRIIGTGIQPVEFGGRASERPNFIGRKYPKDHPDVKKRGELLPCSEVFDKFVSELWFATRYLVEADQCRALPEDTAKDGYMRLWTLVAGNKMSVESKRDMKKRVNRSPDLYDTFATGVEGARRLGLVIGGEAKRNARGANWMAGLKRDYKDELAKGELTYA